jgi:hypothetical protein
MNDFDKNFLAEHKRFEELREKFKKVYTGEAGPKSEKIMDDFVSNFNELAKIFLKTNKKIEVWKEGHNNIYIGGKAGVSTRDYGGEGIEQSKLFPFFANLDKIDAKLQSELTQYYYEKWLNFVSIFGSGVDLIVGNKNESSVDPIEKQINTDIIVLFSMLDSSGRKGSYRKNYDDDDENKNGMVVAKAQKLQVGMRSDHTYCDIILDNGGQINIDEEDDSTRFFLFRDFLEQAIAMEAEYRDAEMVFVNGMKGQYDQFIQKAVPYLSLKEL